MPQVWEDFKDGLRKLAPPDIDAPIKQLHSWRWFIAVTLGVSVTVQAVDIMTSHGYLRPLHPGFARADEVNELKIERATHLGLRILDTREKQCISGDGTVRTLYREAISRMEHEYFDLMGKDFRTPDCKEFRE